METNDASRHGRLRNPEHYPDPTAAIAVENVSPTPVSTWNSTPSYVSSMRFRSPDYSMVVDRMQMNELKDKLLTCSNAKGEPLACVECVNDKGGCVYGRRAVHILDTMTTSDEVSDEVPKMEANNAKRCGADALIKKTVEKYKAAIASGDPVKYIAGIINVKGGEAEHLNRARATLKRWQKQYGDIVEGDSYDNNVAEEDVNGEAPAKNDDVVTDDEVKDVLVRKIEMLTRQRDAISAEIKKLEAEMKKVDKQIASMLSACDCIGIKLHR